MTGIPAYLVTGPVGISQCGACGACGACAGCALCGPSPIGLAWYAATDALLCSFYIVTPAEP